MGPGQAHSKHSINQGDTTCPLSLWESEEILHERARDCERDPISYIQLPAQVATRGSGNGLPDAVLSLAQNPAPISGSLPDRGAQGQEHETSRGFRFGISEKQRGGSATPPSYRSPRCSFSCPQSYPAPGVPPPATYRATGPLPNAVRHVPRTPSTTPCQSDSLLLATPPQDCPIGDKGAGAWSRLLRLWESGGGAGLR